MLSKEEKAVVKASNDPASNEKLLGHPTPLLQDDNDAIVIAARMNIEFFLFLMINLLMCSDCITHERLMVTKYFYMLQITQKPCASCNILDILILF